MFAFVKEKSSFSELDESRLGMLEKQFGVVLPEILKQFYRRHNGAAIHEIWFDYGSHRFSVCRFLPLFAGAFSADRVMEIYRNNAHIPTGWFPFAVDCSGNDYFLDTDSGKIMLVKLGASQIQKEASPSIDAFFHLLNRQTHQNASAYF